MIGVFDSGYGGLTILKEFLKELPQYDYVYLGDNARTPYGNRDLETLNKYAEEAVEFLFKKGCTLIIIACNTASSNVLRHLQEKYLRGPKVTNRKILGVIKPQVEEAIAVSAQGRIGVVGTRSTIESRAYDIELEHLKPGVKVYKQACPLLVPLIEEHWHTKPETKMILKKYLHYLKSCNVDTLILGCTHYPFLYEDFCRMMGKNVQVVHPGKVVAASLKDYLKRHPEIEGKLTRGGSASGSSANGGRTFLTTGEAEKFKAFGRTFFGNEMKEVHHVNIT